MDSKVRETEEGRPTRHPPTSSKDIGQRQKQSRDRTQKPEQDPTPDRLGDRRPSRRPRVRLPQLCPVHRHRRHHLSSSLHPNYFAADSFFFSFHNASCLWLEDLVASSSSSHKVTHSRHLWPLTCFHFDAASFYPREIRRRGLPLWWPLTLIILSLGRPSIINRPLFLDSGFCARFQTQAGLRYRRGQDSTTRAICAATEAVTQPTTPTTTIAPRTILLKSLLCLTERQWSYCPSRAPPPSCQARHTATNTDRILQVRRQGLCIFDQSCQPSSHPSTLRPFCCQGCPRLILSKHKAITFQALPTTHPHSRLAIRTSSTPRLSQGPHLPTAP